MANNFTDDVEFPLIKIQVDTEKIVYVYRVVQFILSFIGVITNSLNIQTFLAMGKEDGVTVTLISLSFSDLGFCVSSLVNVLAFGVTTIEIALDGLFSLDPFVIRLFSANVEYFFYALTSMTTTYLAVARCMCVAKPLQFKNTFTRSRSIAIQVSFALVCLGGYLPVFSQMGAKSTFDANHNKTRLAAWVSGLREQIKDIVFLIFDTIFSLTAQVVLVICLFIMSNSLTKSGKFRQLMKAGTTASDGEKQETQAFKLAGKELQVVQQVVLISAMCFACTIPKMVISIYSLVIPGFSLGKRIQAQYMGSSYLRLTFELVNSASTFFIYYKYNSKFRSICFQKFLTCRKSVDCDEDNNAHPLKA